MRTDPYFLDQNPDPADTFQVTAGDYNDTTGRVQVDPRAIQEKRTGVFIFAGQSLTAGNDDVQYTPINSTVHQINIMDGGVYQAKDPLLGCNVNLATGGSYATRLCDQLVTDGNYDRIIMVPMSVGGTPIETWAKGGVLHHRIPAACNRIKALDLDVTAIFWSQGERDNAWNTPQADYEADLGEVIQAFRDEGISSPFFVNLETLTSGAGTDASIRAAQTAVVDNVTVFQGADFDTIDGTGRYDGTHLNDAGSWQAANLQKARINAELFA